MLLVIKFAFMVLLFYTFTSLAANGGKKGAKRGGATSPASEEYERGSVAYALSYSLCSCGWAYICFMLLIFCNYAI